MLKYNSTKISSCYNLTIVLFHASHQIYNVVKLHGYIAILFTEEIAKTCHHNSYIKCYIYYTLFKVSLYNHLIEK